MPADKILRAGPFGQSADSFVDEPVSAVSSTVPINCAMDDTSSTWVWRHYQNILVEIGGVETSNDSTYEDDLVDFEETVDSSNGDGFYLQTTNTWRYQAMQDFTLTVDFDIASDLTDGTGGEAFVTIKITVDGELIEGNDPTSIYGVTYYDGQPYSPPNLTSASLDQTLDVECPSTDGEPPKLIEIVCTTQMNAVDVGASADGRITLSLA